MVATSLRRWGLVAPLFALAACGESPVTPPATADVVPPPALVVTLPVDFSGSTVDTTVMRFTYVPSTGGTYYFGSEAKLIFPANSVCDVETTSYGPSEWDKPCTPESRPVAITVKAWHDASGAQQLDFSPSMRFVPTHAAPRSVRIFFSGAAYADPATTQWLNIKWVPTPGAVPVDEAAQDRTLRTHVSRGSGWAWRRIKHFSGYNITADRSGPPASVEE